MAQTQTEVELTTWTEPAVPGAEADRPESASPLDTQPHEESGRRHEFSLPPVDGGKDAWLFLAACFAIEALVWGFPFAFGVFQNYYSTHAPFAGEAGIAVIGTCAMGIMYLTAPVIIGTMRVCGRWARWTPLFGLLVMCGALAASSFAQSVSHLVVTQGVLYAIGGGIAYCPCILYMDEWFVKRKGFAYGIMWSGTGLAGVVLPLLMEHLLARYGFRTTLRLWAGLLFGLTAPLAWFVKPRLPASGATRARPFPDLRFARRAPFLLYQAANVAEAAGFFLPGLYLPGYARAAMGAGPLAAAATVLALNVASVAGCVAMGALVDRLHVTTCILASTAGATAACLLLWGLAPALPGLYAFAVLYGLFAGSFTSAWPGIMSEVARKGQDDHHHHHHHHHHHNSNNSSSSNGAGDGSAGYTCDPSMVFGLLAAGRGVGNVVSGPLSESLVKGLPWQGSTGAYGYGSGYGGLIVFTGVTALLGGASFVWRRLGLL